MLLGEYLYIVVIIIIMLDTKCKKLDWVCVPLVVESFGAWGKEALESISQLASRLATCSSKAKSVVLYRTLRAAEPSPGTS